jgi:integrase
MRGHITQRSPGSFTIQVSGGFNDAGKRVRLTRTIRGSKREPEKALTKLLRDVDQGTAVQAGRDTFGAYLTDRWLPHMCSRVGDETWSRYEGLVRCHLVLRCGRVRLAALRPHHLQAALDEMLADGAAPASVVKAHRVAASALQQAVRWQLLPTSPAAGVSPPRTERGMLRIPTPDETRALVKAAQDTPYGLPVLLAATTGMRRGEIMQLRWADVDLEKAVLRGTQREDAAITAHDLATVLDRSRPKASSEGPGESTTPVRRSLAGWGPCL